MRQLKLFALFLVLAISSNLSAQTAVSPELITGTWLTASGKAKVKISKEGNVYNGKIVWLRDPLNAEGKPKTDKNNPNDALKLMPLMGLNMLKNFVFDEDQWVNGTIYDPENGKTYSCKVKYRDGKLDVRGYIGISLLGRTETWFKVADIK